MGAVSRQARRRILWNTPDNSRTRRAATRSPNSHSTARHSTAIRFGCEERQCSCWGGRGQRESYYSSWGAAAERAAGVASFLVVDLTALMLRS